jgi:hypothetical protein
MSTNSSSKPEDPGAKSPWRRRVYPYNGTSILPYDAQISIESFPGSSTSSRIDFSAFINSMDDASFAYLSLLREYASRPLQGMALEYGGLYRAMVSQRAEDETLSRISVIEYGNDGSRSRSFETYDEFRFYLDGEPASVSIRRLIVLEDLPVRFVCLLGSRLGIHPTIFARHYSTGNTSTAAENICYLPSVVQAETQDGLNYESDDELLHCPNNKRSFTLRYPIVMPPLSAKQHPDSHLCPYWLKPDARLNDQCAYPKFLVERSMDTPSKYDQWDTRGEVCGLEGRVTYWHKTSSGGRWDGK